MINNLVPSTPQEYTPPTSPKIKGYLFKLNNDSYYAAGDVDITHTRLREEAAVYSSLCVIAVSDGWGHKSNGHWVVVYE